MTKYKLVALDIDGTLLDSSGQVSNRTKETIHAVSQTGVRILVATGRRLCTARPLVLQLELPDIFLAAHNGAILKELDGKFLYHRLLSRDIARQTVAVAKDLGMCPIAFAGTHDDTTVLIEDYGDRIDEWQRAYLEENRRSLHQVNDLATDLPSDVIEIVCVVSLADAHQITEAFETRMNQQVKPILVTTTDQNRAFIGLTNPNVSKREPLRYLTEEMNINPEEVVAIGDNYNDLDMLNFAGVGIVMENVVPPLKQMGFHVTASNDEDGVAKALEEFVLDS